MYEYQFAWKPYDLVKFPQLKTFSLEFNNAAGPISSDKFNVQRSNKDFKELKIVNTRPGTQSKYNNIANYYLHNILETMGKLYIPEVDMKLHTLYIEIEEELPEIHSAYMDYARRLEMIPKTFNIENKEYKMNYRSIGVDTYKYYITYEFYDNDIKYTISIHAQDLEAKTE